MKLLSLRVTFSHNPPTSFLRSIRTHQLPPGSISSCYLLYFPIIHYSRYLPSCSTVSASTKFPPSLFLCRVLQQRCPLKEMWRGKDCPLCFQSKKRAFILQRLRKPSQDYIVVTMTTTQDLHRINYHRNKTTAMQYTTISLPPFEDNNVFSPPPNFFSICSGVYHCFIGGVIASTFAICKVFFSFGKFG